MIVTNTVAGSTYHDTVSDTEELAALLTAVWRCEYLHEYNIVDDYAMSSVAAII